MISYHNNKLLIHVGMSDTLAAPELRGTEGLSMTEDYHYYAIKGRYNPGVEEPLPGPSDEFRKKLKELDAGESKAKRLVKTINKKPH